jgi:hypothetical protein
MSATQAGTAQIQSEYLLLLSVSLIAVGLALFIVLHAFRGYQRSNSTRMLFLASGLSLVTVVPMALSIGVNTFGQTTGLQPRVYTFYLPMAIRVCEIVGLCALLYSLLIVPGHSKET